MSINPQEIVRNLLAHRSAILSYLYGLGRDMHLAEDTFQDVVIKATEHHEEIRDAEHLQAWARRVGRNAVIDSLRQSKRRPVIFDSDVLDRMESEWVGIDSGEQAGKLDALRICLDRLSSASRRLVEMRYREGLTGEETARRLGRTRSSVYVSLSRAHKVLEACIRGRIEGVSGD